MADTLQMLGRGAQILVALGAAYLIALWFVLIVWTFRDIEARSRSVLTQIISTLLVVLFFVPGVLLYLILRPKETLDEAFQRSLEEEYLLQDLEELPLCPGCHRYVEDEFVLCPHCRTQLREACPACSRLVDLRWALCPYCGASQIERDESLERVEQPAARWSAPALRRRRTSPEPRPVERPAAAARELPPVALPVQRDGEAPAPVAREAEPQGLTVIPGKRSIIRPFDRFRGRSDNETDPAATPVAENGRREVEVNGARSSSNGSGASHQAHRLFDALNGKGTYQKDTGSTPARAPAGDKPSNGAAPAAANGRQQQATGAAVGLPRPTSPANGTEARPELAGAAAQDEKKID